MNRRVPELRKLLRRIGWPALIGGALLLCAAALLAIAVGLLDDEVSALHAQVLAAQKRLHSAGTTVPADTSVPEQLRAFYAFFPTTDSVPHWLDALHTIGRDAGVTIRFGDYRLERQEGGLWRYSVTIPVAGSYPQVRQFIVFVLKEAPAASLDDVQLRREGERIEARLRFSLHFAGN